MPAPKALIQCTAALALSFAATVPASAQPEDLYVPDNATWEHDWTEMEFPPNIGTFERMRVSAFEKRQTNVSASYYEQATSTFLTIYAYRPGNPNPAIWFDRTLVAINVRSDDFGKIDLDDLKVGTFVPPGGSVESGQYAVTKVQGRAISTAAAIYRAGEWLIKVRISSERLNVGELETLTKSTLAGLPALEDVSDNPAYFVEQCSNTVNYSRAEPVARGGNEGMAAALMLASSLSGLDEDAGPSKPVRLCREGPRAKEYNLFRPIDDSAGYTVAIGDAGSSIEVSEISDLGPLIPSDTATKLFSVTSSTGLETKAYTAFKGMPSPRQAGQAYNGPVIVETTRPLAEDEKPETQVFVASESE